MSHVSKEIDDMLHELESELEQFEREAARRHMPVDMECELITMRAELTQLRELAK